MTDIRPKAVKTSPAKRARRGRLTATLSKTAETSKSEVIEDLSRQADQQATLAADLKKFKTTSDREVSQWLAEHPYVQTVLTGVGFTLVNPRRAYNLAREIAEKTLARQLEK